MPKGNISRTLVRFNKMHALFKYIEMLFKQKKNPKKTFVLV